MAFKCIHDLSVLRLRSHAYRGVLDTISYGVDMMALDGPSARFAEISNWENPSRTHRFTKLRLRWYDRLYEII